MKILLLLKLGITMLIHNKDDIEFVTEFPCFLGHPVYLWFTHYMFFFVPLDFNIYTVLFLPSIKDKVATFFVTPTLFFLLKI